MDRDHLRPGARGGLKARSKPGQGGLPAGVRAWTIGWSPYRSCPVPTGSPCRSGLQTRIRGPRPRLRYAPASVGFQPGMRSLRGRFRRLRPRRRVRTCATERLQVPGLESRWGRRDVVAEDCTLIGSQVLQRSYVRVLRRCAWAPVLTIAVDHIHVASSHISFGAPARWPAERSTQRRSHSLRRGDGFVLLP